MEKEPTQIHVVGIGASAGGLDALSKFLSQFNGTKVNVCVVIVMHLSPDYKSELAMILNKRCKWPVVTVDKDMKIQSQQIYVAPPNHHIHLEDNRLILEGLSKEYYSSPSIDNFFISLAQEKKNKAIGIILSGFGNDGSKGIKAIKDNHGFTMAQLPETSEHNNMPVAAIDTGKVDVVVPAEQMFDEIVQYITNTRVISTSGNKNNPKDAIFDLLEKRSGTDFSMYKPTTIMRRINHRIKSLQLSNLVEYYNFIKKSPRELDVLFDTVLIGVTEFFRDTEAFEAIKDQLETLLEEKQSGDGIRIWSVGCATGEEPYSIAILLYELLAQKTRQFHIQIFASDIDEKALNYARKATYPKESLANIPAEFVDKYFDEKDSIHYELKKEIKQHVLFTRHDITNDPPFVKLDMVICRNLLIYFNNNLQKQSFQIFHYSLRPKGVLFLGKSESVSVAADLFIKVNKGKIFRKADASLNYHLKFSRIRNSNVKTYKEEKSNTIRNMDIVGIAKETLYYKYQHPFVIINDQSEIKEVHGSLRLYMEMSQGAMNANLQKMVNPELTIAVKALQAQVKNTGVSHTSHVIKFQLYDQQHFVRIRMMPLMYLVNDTQYYIVVFEKIEPSEHHLQIQEKLDTTNFVNIRIKELEDELESTKEHLQIFTEELEATNEELQTINEELQSANEELKSSNEELETSNEELQSANEELNTANNELRITNELMIQKEDELRIEKKLSERNELIYRTIAENIPNGTVGILNDKLEIEYVAGQGLRDTTSADLIGKIMPDINPSKKEAARLRKLCNETLKGKSGKIEVTYDNRFYAVYTELFDFHFTDGKKILYLVQEITEDKRNQRNLHTALKASELVIFEYDFKKDLVIANELFLRMFEFEKGSKVTDADIQNKVHPEDRSKRKKSIKKGLKTGVIEHEVRLNLSEEIRHVRVKGKVLFDEYKEPTIVVASVQNITKDKQLLNQVQESEERFRMIADSAPLTIWMSDPDKSSTYVNKNWLDYTGSTFEENLGTGFLSFVHPEDVDSVVEEYSKAFDEKEIFRLNYRAKRRDGAYRWFLNYGVPIEDADKNFKGYIGINLDITDQLQFTTMLENKVEERTKELSDANKELIKLNMNLEEFAYMASHDLKEPLRKIRTFNSILQAEKVTDEELGTYTDKIENSAKRMTDLIETILEFSKIEKTILKYDNFDLNILIEQVLSDLGVLIKENKVKVQLEELGKIHGVSIRVYQLCSNLIRNAIKFNKKRPEIVITSRTLQGNEMPSELKAESSKMYKQIEFSDNGIGLDMEKSEYIFKPFKRLHSRDQYPGTGIGLAICKSIMDLHKGYITVDSKEGEGTTFLVFFPILDMNTAIKGDLA